MSAAMEYDENTNNSSHSEYGLAQEFSIRMRVRILGRHQMCRFPCKTVQHEGFIHKNIIPDASAAECCPETIHICTQTS